MNVVHLWLPASAWGVALASSNPLRVQSVLIGESWDHRRSLHPDAPQRPLLFRTKVKALAFCATKHHEYRARPLGDICREWRFFPVRLRESWEVV